MSFEEYKKWVQEMSHFFSNKCKPQREKWIVRQFLELIQLKFDEQDILIQPNNSKIDIIYKDANFQIKEIPNPEEDRGEFKDLNKKIKNAKDPSDIKYPIKSYDMPPVCKMYDLIISNLEILSKKYEKEASKLDLLFFVTRIRSTFVEKNEINRNLLESFKFRSISYFASDRVMILYATREAPIFLRELYAGV